MLPKKFPNDVLKKLSNEFRKQLLNQFPKRNAEENSKGAAEGHLSKEITERGSKGIAEGIHKEIFVTICEWNSPKSCIRNFHRNFRTKLWIKKTLPGYFWKKKSEDIPIEIVEVFCEAIPRSIADGNYRRNCRRNSIGIFWRNSQEVCIEITEIIRK